MVFTLSRCSPSSTTSRRRRDSCLAVLHRQADMLCMGFYPTQSMWMGKKLSPIPPDVVGTPECAVAMHQAIRWYGSHEDYTLWITRDGLVVVAFMKGLLDKEGINPDTEAETPGVLPLTPCMPA